ncbi:MAG: response regulator [Bacteroidia bacterium]|nr:response regulator [Bacteroidia bacterium]
MEVKTKILIVEDDPIIAEDLQATLNEFGYEALEPADNADAALKSVRINEPDLCMLDVHLGHEIDGIQLADMINKDHNIPIVFLTAFNDRSTIDRIMATNPAGYLVKPVDERNLQTTLELALHSFHRTHEKQPESSFEGIQSDSIFVKIKDRLVKISLNEILYLEAYDNYVFLHTKDKKHLLSSSLKSVDEKLPSNLFLRVHRSYIVNLKKIDGIGQSYIHVNRTEIPIGKTYRERLMAAIDLL